MAKRVGCGNQTSGFLIGWCSSCKNEGHIMNSIEENNVDEREKNKDKRRK